VVSLYVRAAPRVQFFAGADNWWPHSVLRYH